MKITEYFPRGKNKAANVSFIRKHFTNSAMMAITNGILEKCHFCNFSFFKLIVYIFYVDIS